MTLLIVTVRLRHKLQCAIISRMYIISKLKNRKNRKTEKYITETDKIKAECHVHVSAYTHYLHTCTLAHVKRTQCIAMERIRI